MKRYALISSILAVSLANHCMENEASKQTSIILTTPHTHSINEITFKPAQLTTKAQTKVSQEPLLPFSLTNEEIKELQAIETTRNQINRANTALFEQMSPKLNEENNLFFRKIRDLNIKREWLTHKLDIVQRSKNFEILEEIKTGSNIAKKEQKPEKPCNKDLMLGITTLLKLSIDLHQEIVAIQQFNDHELCKEETRRLFESIKNHCLWHKNNIIVDINFFVDQLENLQQEQETSNQ